MRIKLLAMLLIVNYTIKAQIGELIWEDDFNTLNEDVWNSIEGDGCDIGLCGWGNAELEYYRGENISIETITSGGETGITALVLEAKQETHGGRNFTSGKVDSENKLSVHYGMISIRMMTPSVDTGLWPAAWLLGTSNLNWPAKGEIDMMEMGQSLSQRTEQGHASADIDSYVGANAIFAAEDGNQASIAHDAGFNKPYVASTSLANRFVEYRLYWEPTQMRFTVIDEGTEHDLYEAPFPISQDDITSPLTKPFYFLLNLAVGGNFTDAITDNQVTATLPSKLYIDYVRVYEWNGYGSVQENYSDLIPETGAFGVFTEETPVDDGLTIGLDSDIFIWGGTFGQGTTEAYDGNEVIAWETSNANSWFGGGILSTDGRDMSSFTQNGSLKFDIKIPADVSFRIGITDNSDTESWLEFNANEDQYGLTRNGEWGEVTIPIADFGTDIDYTDIGYMFAILSVDGQEPSSTYELGIDDIIWTDGNSTGTSVTDITVSPSSLTIPQNSTYQLSASIFPESAINTNVTWSSLNNSIVSVDQNGLVTANQEGTTTIRVISEDGNLQANSFITVGEAIDDGNNNGNNNPSHLNFGVYTDTTIVDENLTIGENANLFVWAGFTGGNETAYEGDNVISWETTPATGWFGAGILADPGQNMTGYDTNGSLKFNIKIPADISFRIGITDNSGNESWLNINGNENKYGLTRDGEWGQVEIPFSEFSNDIDYSDMAYMFAILSVDGAFSETAFELAIDNIVWESGNDADSVFSVAITSNEDNLNVNETLQLEASVFPATALNKNITWSSSNPSVATVDQNGLVTSINDGTAEITVTTEEGGFYDSITLTVGEVILEHLSFGVFTDNTIVDNELTIGDNANIFAWNGFIGGSETAFEGDNAIAWESPAGTAWFGGGVQADPSQDMSGYETEGFLSFNIKIPADVSFRIGITDGSDNQSFVNLNGNEDKYGLTRDGEWGQVEIPFTEFSSNIDYSDISYMLAILSVDGEVPTDSFQLGLDNIVWDNGVNKSVLSTDNNDTLEANIILYPNPTVNNLNISSTNSLFIIETVEIIDMNGKIVKSNKYLNNTIQIEISNLSSGLYFAKVTSTSGNTVIKKIYKN